MRTDTIKPARIIDAYRRILWRLHTDRLPPVRFAARFSARYSHSMTSLVPLDQSRSGLCQNRSRSAIGIILLSDWFWLATLIREQRWCVALSRACCVERCELVGLRPSLRNLIIWLDYHHVLPPFSLPLSRYFFVTLRFTFRYCDSIVYRFERFWRSFGCGIRFERTYLILHPLFFKDTLSHTRDKLQKLNR